MHPIILLGGAIAAAVTASKLSAKKETQGVAVKGAVPGVRVVTPVPKTVTKEQHTATVTKPKPAAHNVVVPAAAKAPITAARPMPVETPRSLTNTPGPSLYPPKVSQFATPAKPVPSVPPSQSAGFFPSAAASHQSIAITAKADGGSVFAPPNAVQPNQSLPIVVTPTGMAAIGISSIQDVQRTLNALGYMPTLKVDGVLGKQTIANLKQFQGKAGLVVDGNGGPATKTALSAALSALAAGANAHIAEAVKAVTVATAPPMTNAEVQRLLNVLGAKPPLVEDGALGPKSISAIKSFQVSHGLTPDGIVGPKTKAALAIAARG